MLRMRFAMLLAAAALLAGCLIDTGNSGSELGAASPFAFRGEIGDTCAQLAWSAACEPGLTCAAAPEHRLDSFCTRTCRDDAQCGAAGACFDGQCVERCGQRDDFFRCPFGSEREVSGACICVPGRPRPADYDDEGP